jgi:hypothetical protein
MLRPLDGVRDRIEGPEASVTRCTVTYSMYHDRRDPDDQLLPQLESKPLIQQRALVLRLASKAPSSTGRRGLTSDSH